MSNQTLAVDFPKINDFRFTNVGALIVKLTRRCNLNCSYCYENITKSGDMDIKVFKDLANRAIFNTERNQVDFILHGGEPTLLPIDFFEEAFTHCLEVSEAVGKTAKFSIQTNLLSLSDAKIDLFRKYDVSVGASTDGPNDLRAMRQGLNKFIRNYHRAIDKGLKIGILTTINQSNFYQFNEIIDWLDNVLKVKDFKANVVYSVGAGSGLPNMLAEDIHEAQKTIIKHMIETKGKGIYEQNIGWMIDWYFRETDNKANSLCHAKTCGAGKKVLGIGTDGKLLPCGRFEWSETEQSLGFLNDITSKDIFKNKINDFHSLAPENWFNCSTCDAKKICNYGCQAFIVRSKSRANVECIPTKMLYQFFKENESQLRVIHENLVLNGFINLSPNYDDSRYGDGKQEPYVDKYDDSYKDYKDYKDYSDKSDK